MVERLLSKLKALGSVLSSENKKKKENYLQISAHVSHAVWVFILASETLSALVTYPTVVFESHVFLM